MKEIDIALTDYGLTLLCFIVAFLLNQSHSNNSGLTTWFSVLFLSVGLASGIGGSVHGFVHEDTLLHSILWRGVILCIGVSTLSAWMIGAKILSDGLTRTLIGALAITNFTIYLIYVLLFNQNFGVAVANYLPSAIFLIFAFSYVYKQTFNRLALLALVGLILTFVAAGIQQLEIGIHSTYFGHNALYHVVQAAGLYLIFLGARFIVKFNTE